jgi:hypothetical protein
MEKTVCGGGGHIYTHDEGDSLTVPVVRSGPHAIFPQTFLNRENCFLRALKYCP